MNVFISFLIIMSKNVLKTYNALEKNLPGKMELFELRILKSGDLNLNADTSTSLL